VLACIIAPWISLNSLLWLSIFLSCGLGGGGGWVGKYVNVFWIEKTIDIYGRLLSDITLLHFTGCLHTAQPICPKYLLRTVDAILTACWYYVTHCMTNLLELVTFCGQTSKAFSTPNRWIYINDPTDWFHLTSTVCGNSAWLES